MKGKGEKEEEEHNDNSTHMVSDLRVRDEMNPYLLCLYSVINISLYQLSSVLIVELC